MSSSLKHGWAAPTPWFVAIGASGSTGMLDIRTLLTAMRPNIDAIVLIVLHRSFSYPSELHEILARETGMRVILAKDGEHFERGSCYIGKPAAHLSLAARSFGKLVEDPRASHRNRTIDLLFRSVAAHGGGRVIGVILSGALDDGSRGLAAIHDMGGRTMVLTPSAFSTTDGMPENAINYNGPIDFIGWPLEIAAAIHRLVDMKEATHAL
jgi:two-component system, chemotaxis family, protein-glutamate methylesterase/glutaminase